MQRRGNISLAQTNKDRFAFVFASLVGKKVQVKLKTQAVYEGMFSGVLLDKEYTVALKYARELPSASKPSGPVVDEYIIPGKEIISLEASDIPLNGLDDGAAGTSGAFKTDTEIRRGQAGKERDLERWSAQATDSKLSDMQDFDSGKAGSWDQFATNKEKFGVTSTYSEELYTTQLDISKIPLEHQTKADRIARAIEASRGLEQDQEIGNDYDEELAFSAVAGTGGYKVAPLPPSGKNAYVPPHLRATAKPGVPQTGLNALNLEPATARPREVPLTAQNLQKHLQAETPAKKTHGAHSPVLSEMKGINALNLEPAQLPKADFRRADASDSRRSSGARGSIAAKKEETKQEFQQSLQEVNDRMNKNAAKPKLAPSSTMMSAVQSSQAAVRPKGLSTSVTGTPVVEAIKPPVSTPSGGRNFSFNPNVIEFVPGRTVPSTPAAAPAPAASTLNIAITPGGSLSGTLKGSQFDQQFDQGNPPPPPQPPMVYGYVPQGGFHPQGGPFMMMPPHPGMPLPPIPAFSPLCEGSALERATSSEALSLMFDAASAARSTSWPADGESYKRVLGDCASERPANINFLPPPPPFMGAPQGMMVFTHPPPQGPPVMMQGWPPQYGPPQGYYGYPQQQRGAPGGLVFPQQGPPRHYQEGYYPRGPRYSQPGYPQPHPGQQPGHPGQHPGHPGHPGQHPGHPGQHPGHPGQHPGHPGQHPGHPGQHPGHPGQHPGHPGHPNHYEGSL